MTGLSTLVPGDFFGKQIEILRELVPGASKIAFLINPENAMNRAILADEIPRHARNTGVALPVVEATKPEELDIAFEAAVAQHADAIVVVGDYLTIFHAPQIVALAAKICPQFISSGYSPMAH
jgi:putative tryptophan/tyrosine transport system substrate-binding protein